MRNPLIPRKAETPTPSKPLKPVGKLKLKKSKKKLWRPGDHTREYLKPYGYSDEFIEEYIRKNLGDWKPHSTQLTYYVEVDE